MPIQPQPAQSIEVPLIGGFYQARSVIADDTQCINLYPEKNPEGSPTRYTDYLTPGLTVLRANNSANGPNFGFGRGGYVASNGQLYICVGSTVYSVDSQFRFTVLGNITTNTPTPVYMQDNGIDMVIVDGSANGFVVHLANNLMSPYPGLSVASATVASGGSGGTNGAVTLTVVGGNTTSGVVATLSGIISGGALSGALTVVQTGAYSVLPTNPVAVTGGGLVGATVNLTANANTFLGATRADYLDTFILFPQPNSRNFYSTLSNTLQINPLYITAKASYPDNISSLIVVHREIWLLGAQKSTEIWYDAGGATFPFQIEPGVYVEQGCVAKYSVARHDLKVFWLGQNADGLNTVFMGTNYQAVPISTYAISNTISQYSTVSDAIGFCYQQLDHVFYILTFPTADATWVYDITEKLWHQRATLDNNGVFHRILPGFLVSAFGKVIGCDWQTGTLYNYDLNNNTDNGQPIVRVRTFPHIVNKSKRSAYSRFIADMECGTALTGDFTITLSWSDDRGKTWSNPLTQSLGAQGQYLTWPSWPGNLGIARDKLFKLSFSSPVSTALNGAYVNVTPAQT